MTKMMWYHIAFKVLIVASLACFAPAGEAVNVAKCDNKGHCACPDGFVCVDSSVANDGCKTGHKQLNEQNVTTMVSGYTSGCSSCQCVLSELFESGKGTSIRPAILVLGMIKEFRRISPGVMRWMHQLSCSKHMDVRIHVLVAKERSVRITGGKWVNTNKWREVYPDSMKIPYKPCHIEIHEDSDPHLPKIDADDRQGRVARISEKRDVLRELVKQRYHGDEKWEHAAVAVADLDLVDQADPIWVREAAIRVTNTKEAPDDIKDLGKLDMVCSNGRDTNPAHFVYYDTFSTILSPNTFVFPLDKRKNVGKVFDGEDRKYIIETVTPGLERAKIHQRFTRTDLAQLMDLSGPVVPVRSCFGGLTLYRADAYFQSDCYYSKNVAEFNPDDRYSNSFTPGIGEESAACEHVILHECIRKTRGLAAVLGRDLRPQWTRENIFFDDK